MLTNYGKTYVGYNLTPLTINNLVTTAMLKKLAEKVKDINFVYHGHEIKMHTDIFDPYKFIFGEEIETACARNVTLYNSIPLWAFNSDFHEYLGSVWKANIIEAAEDIPVGAGVTLGDELRNLYISIITTTDVEF